MPKTWVPSASGGAALLDDVARHRPAYAAALAEVVEAIWDQDVVDSPTLELCRLRIGQLLGASPVAERVDPALAAALPSWPTDDRFDDRLRTVLGYAEAVLLDAQEVGDARARQVIDAVGEDGFLVLTYACGVFETTQRAEIILAEGGTRS